MLIISNTLLRIYCQSIFLNIYSCLSQILLITNELQSSKKITAQGSSADRYRLLLSDGEVSYSRKFMGLMIKKFVLHCFYSISRLMLLPLPCTQGYKVMQAIINDAFAPWQVNHNLLNSMEKPYNCSTFAKSSYLNYMMYCRTKMFAGHYL